MPAEPRANPRHHPAKWSFRAPKSRSFGSLFHLQSRHLQVPARTDLNGKCPTGRTDQNEIVQFHRHATLGTGSLGRIDLDGQFSTLGRRSLAHDGKTERQGIGNHPGKEPHQNGNPGHTLRTGLFCLITGNFHKRLCNGQLVHDDISQTTRPVQQHTLISWHPLTMKQGEGGSKPIKPAQS